MRKKLFLSSLAIVLITLILSMIAVSLVIKRQFSDYLVKTTEATIQQFPERLSTIYSYKGFWDPVSLSELSHYLPMDTQMTIKDSSGNVITSLTNPMGMMHGGMGNMGNMMGMNMEYSVNQWKTKTYEIPSPKGVLGSATFEYPAGAQTLNPQDISFVSAVVNSLILAGALALLIGALLSYWTSRHLVTPLQHLTQAAYRIGHGHLNERVQISTKDEVGQLALAFDSMADSLEQQERHRKQFTADIAHELRTPLTSMRSYIEAFQDGVLPANQENLTALNEEIDRLVNLASDLKDLNVAEMGALSLNLQKVDLNSLLDKIIRNLSPLILEKGLNLNRLYAEQHHFIYGDERLLTRLFYNLIHNAYKYTEGNGTISVEMTYASTECVNIKISDTGIGIPESDLALIFERFYRTDKSRTRETGGTGIGLALVRQIVALHHGSIQVESQIGKGTMFTVQLPVNSDYDTNQISHKLNMDKIR